MNKTLFNCILIIINIYFILNIIGCSDDVRKTAKTDAEVVFTIEVDPTSLNNVSEEFSILFTTMFRSPNNMDATAYVGSNDNTSCQIVVPNKYTIYSGLERGKITGQHITDFLSSCAQNNQTYYIRCEVNDNGTVRTSNTLHIPVGISNDPNRRPDNCGINNIHTKDIEYNCMETFYDQTLHEWVYCSLSDEYWDNEMQAAWVDKCNISLNYHVGTTNITHVLINTNTGSNSDIISALDYFYNQHHTTNYHYLCGVDGLTNYGSLPSAGMTNDPTNTWSFIFVGQLYRSFTSVYRSDAIRHTIAHELGHQFGIHENENHSGNGSPCCIMQPYYITDGCTGTELYFCDTHACFLYAH